MCNIIPHHVWSATSRSLLLWPERLTCLINSFANIFPATMLYSPMKRQTNAIINTDETKPPVFHRAYIMALSDRDTGLRAECKISGDFDGGRTTVADCDGGPEIAIFCHRDIYRLFRCLDGNVWSWYCKFFDNILTPDASADIAFDFKVWVEAWELRI